MPDEEGRVASILPQLCNILSPRCFLLRQLQMMVKKRTKTKGAGFFAGAGLSLREDGIATSSRGAQVTQLN